MTETYVSNTDNAAVFSPLSCLGLIVVLNSKASDQYSGSNPRWIVNYLTGWILTLSCHPYQSLWAFTVVYTRIL